MKASKGRPSRQESGDELAKAYRLLEEAQDIARTGGWEYDVASAKIYWTTGVYRIYGVEFDFDPNDLDRCIEFYAPESAPIISQAFQRALELGEPYDLELQLNRADGKTIWIKTVGRATRENGKIVRVSGDIIDIDELKRSQLEVASLNAKLERLVLERTARLERANKDLDVFLHALSHDLKAPMRAIAGFSRMIAEDYADALDTEGRRKLTVVSDNITLLDSMLAEILSLARIDTAKTEWTRIDMRAMAVAMYHETASQEDAATVDLSVCALPNAYGDSTLMRKVWGNLFSRALSSTLGRDKRTISVQAQPENDGLKYVIADNGQGYSQTCRDRLFLPFAHLSGGPDCSIGDIGLAVVKRIVEIHLGRVGAESEEGQGSRLWFWLPGLHSYGHGGDADER